MMRISACSTIFNLSQNDLKHMLTGTPVLAPMLLKESILILLYVDDLLLMSQSQTGLQRLLDAFEQNYVLNSLEINNVKSKVLYYTVFFFLKMKG